MLSDDTRVRGIRWADIKDTYSKKDYKEKQWFQELNPAE